MTHTKTPAWAVGMRKLMAGVYLDRDRNLHLSAEELCEFLDVPYTKENAQTVESSAMDAVKRMFPHIATSRIDHGNDPA